VPHNTDHFQVRLGLVLFLVTWRDIVPHNTDHFHIGLLSEVVPLEMSWNVVWFGCVFIKLAYVKGGDVVCCLKS